MNSKTNSNKKYQSWEFVINWYWQWCMILNSIMIFDPRTRYCPFGIECAIPSPPPPLIVLCYPIPSPSPPYAASLQLSPWLPLLHRAVCVLCRAVVVCVLCAVCVPCCCMLCHAVVCCAMLLCAVPCCCVLLYRMLLCAVPCHAVPCCSVLLFHAVVCCSMLCCCSMLLCVVPCCCVLYHAVLCCAMLLCAVLCCCAVLFARRNIVRASEARLCDQAWPDCVARQQEVMCHVTSGKPQGMGHSQIVLLVWNKGIAGLWYIYSTDFGVPDQGQR